MQRRLLSTICFIALFLTAVGCSDDNTADPLAKANLNDNPNLVGHYSMDGTAENSLDGLDGDLKGNPDLVPDRFGNAQGAVRFGRNETYMVVRNVSGTRLEPTEALSISLWVYGYASDVNLPGFHCCGELVSKFGSFGNGYSVKWFHNNDRMLQLQLVQGAVGNSTPMDSLRVPNTPLLNNWHHVVYTYSKTSRTIRLYIDKVLVLSKANCVYDFAHSGDDLWIGGHDHGTTNSVADVALDDIRIYDVEIDQSVVDELYHEDGYDD